MAYDPMISDLLDIYGSFLTEKQKTCLDLYYNQDFSLSEIAQYYNITRQGISDFVSRGRANLLDLEKKIKFNSKLKNLKKDVAKIIDKTNRLIKYNDQNYCSGEINKFANEICDIAQKYI